MPVPCLASLAVMIAWTDMSPAMHKKLLQSPAWRRLRKRVLADRRCVKCWMLFPLTKLEADHNPPVDWKTTVTQFFDPKQIRCLCKTCHGKVTAQQMARYSKPDSPLDENGEISAEWIAWRQRSRRCPVRGASAATPAPR